MLILSEIEDGTRTPVSTISYWVEYFKDAIQALLDSGDDHRLLAICAELRRQKKFPGLCQAVHDFLDETQPDRASSTTAVQRGGHARATKPDPTASPSRSSRSQAPNTTSYHRTVSPAASETSFRAAEENTTTPHHAINLARNPLPERQNSRGIPAENGETTARLRHPHASAQNARLDFEADRLRNLSLNPTPVHQKAKPRNASPHVAFATEVKGPVRGTSVNQAKATPCLRPTDVPRPAAAPAPSKAPSPGNIVRRRSTSAAGPAKDARRSGSKPKIPAAHTPNITMSQCEGISRIIITTLHDARKIITAAPGGQVRSRESATTRMIGKTAIIVDPGEEVRVDRTMTELTYSHMMMGARTHRILCTRTAVRLCDSLSRVEYG